MALRKNSDMLMAISLPAAIHRGDRIPERKKAHIGDHDIRHCGEQGGCARKRPAVETLNFMTAEDDKPLLQVLSPQN